ncbi:unannotated protein [freshwater metagenome]|uniref:Unannotated protein n=1 Tax=freshwater metagenome TaxID=449393 RepID=A0A6J7VBG9_9ZZZZ
MYALLATPAVVRTAVVDVATVVTAEVKRLAPIVVNVTVLAVAPARLSAKLGVMTTVTVSPADASLAVKVKVPVLRSVKGNMAVTLAVPLVV